MGLERRAKPPAIVPSRMQAKPGAVGTAAHVSKGRGIRVARKLLPSGLMPSFSMIIACADVETIVDTDLAEELWDLQLGARNRPHRGRPRHRHR